MQIICSKFYTAQSRVQKRNNKNIILLVVLLYVVPTELTEYTEAYGLKLLESTEKPTLREAGTHGNDGYILQAIISVHSVV